MRFEWVFGLLSRRLRKFGIKLYLCLVVLLIWRVRCCWFSRLLSFVDGCVEVSIVERFVVILV